MISRAFAHGVNTAVAELLAAKLPGVVARFNASYSNATHSANNSTAGSKDTHDSTAAAADLPTPATLTATAAAVDSEKSGGASTSAGARVSSDVNSSVSSVSGLTSADSAERARATKAISRAIAGMLVTSGGKSKGRKSYECKDNISNAAGTDDSMSTESERTGGLHVVIDLTRKSVFALGEDDDNINISNGFFGSSSDSVAATANASSNASVTKEGEGAKTVECWLGALSYASANQSQLKTDTSTTPTNADAHACADNIGLKKSNIAVDVNSNAPDSDDEDRSCAFTDSDAAVRTHGTRDSHSHPAATTTGLANTAANAAGASNATAGVSSGVAPIIVFPNSTTNAASSATQMPPPPPPLLSTTAHASAAHVHFFADPATHSQSHANTLTADAPATGASSRFSANYDGNPNVSNNNCTGESSSLSGFRYRPRAYSVTAAAAGAAAGRNSSDSNNNKNSGDNNRAANAAAAAFAAFAAANPSSNKSASASSNAKIDPEAGAGAGTGRRRFGSFSGFIGNNPGDGSNKYQTMHLSPLSKFQQQQFHRQYQQQLWQQDQELQSQLQLQQGGFAIGGDNNVGLDEALYNSFVGENTLSLLMGALARETAPAQATVISDFILTQQQQPQHRHKLHHSSTAESIGATANPNSKPFVTTTTRFIGNSAADTTNNTNARAHHASFTGTVPNALPLTKHRRSHSSSSINISSLIPHPSSFDMSFLAHKDATPSKDRSARRGGVDAGTHAHEAGTHAPRAPAVAVAAGAAVKPPPVPPRPHSRAGSPSRSQQQHQPQSRAQSPSLLSLLAYRPVPVVVPSHLASDKNLSATYARNLSAFEHRNADMRKKASASGSVTVHAGAMSTPSLMHSATFSPEAVPELFPTTLASAPAHNGIATRVDTSNAQRQDRKSVV